MSIDHSRLESLLDSSNIGILDGGLATYLEDGLHFDLSKGPLWSARLLDEKEDDVSNGKGQQGIFDAHLHYLQAGAGIIGTATYQASLESFARADYPESSASHLMTKAVDIASKALRSYNEAADNGHSSAKALISLSLGPYGGMLSNGAEYTGDYRRTFLPESDPEREMQPTLEQMTAFHKSRVETFIDHDGWKDVGVLALETVPRADEALAFRLALEQIVQERESQGKSLEKRPVYISFAFPNDRRLPWPPASEAGESEEEQQEGDEDMKDGSLDIEDEEMNWLIQIVMSTQVQGVASRWPIAGIGINCTKPYLLSPLVAKMSASLKFLNKPIDEGGIALEATRADNQLSKPLLFLYPDGGLVYDAVNKIWLTPSSEGKSSDAANDSGMSWASNLMKLAQDTMSSKQSEWRGVFVGGCCKSGTEEIRALCQCREKAQA